MIKQHRVGPLDRVDYNPDLMDLTTDEGYIGQILRKLEPWIVKEASRWEDPWGFLSGVPGLPVEFYEAFEAARSQRQAWHHLAHIALRAGTLHQDWFRNLRIAIASGDSKATELATQKVFSALWRLQMFRESEKDPTMCQEIKAEIRRRGQSEFHKVAKARGLLAASQTDPLPRGQELRYDKVAFLLVCWWLRCGKNAPGLCFFSNRAITQLFSWILEGKKDLEQDAVKTTRRYLHLKPASRKNPVISDIWIDPKTGEIRGTNGFRFSGRIVFNGSTVLETSRFAQKLTPP